MHRVFTGSRETETTYNGRRGEPDRSSTGVACRWTRHSDVLEARRGLRGCQCPHNHSERTESVGLLYAAVCVGTLHAQTEGTDLAIAGEALEVERDELAEQIALLTSERDTLAGKADQQAAELVEQGQRIAREQQAAEAARVDLAKARLKLKAHAERHAEQGAELERLRQTLEAEHSARVAAEQQAAVLEARLEASAADARRAAERAERAEQAASLSATALENARVAAAEAQENGARLAGQVDSLQASQRAAEQVATQSASALEAARAAVADARENGARLAGQVESLQEMQKTQAAEMARLRTQLAAGISKPKS